MQKKFIEPEVNVVKFEPEVMLINTSGSGEGNFGGEGGDPWGNE